MGFPGGHGTFRGQCGTQQGNTKDQGGAASSRVGGKQDEQRGSSSHTLPGTLSCCPVIQSRPRGRPESAKGTQCQSTPQQEPADSSCQHPLATEHWKGVGPTRSERGQMPARVATHRCLLASRARPAAPSFLEGNYRCTGKPGHPRVTSCHASMQEWQCWEALTKPQAQGFPDHPSTLDLSQGYLCSPHDRLAASPSVS